MSNINVANIVNPTTADSTPTDNLSKQVCKAWVNFNGVGTVAIRSAYNVSSITDNGVGDYTVNFTSAMPDANYSVVGGAGDLNVTNEISSQINVNGPYTTSSIRIATGYVTYISQAQEDRSVINFSVFR